MSRYLPPFQHNRNALPGAEALVPGGWTGLWKDLVRQELAKRFADITAPQLSFPQRTLSVLITERNIVVLRGAFLLDYSGARALKSGHVHALLDSLPDTLSRSEREHALERMVREQLDRLTEETLEDLPRFYPSLAPDSPNFCRHFQSVDFTRFVPALSEETFVRQVDEAAQRYLPDLNTALRRSVEIRLNHVTERSIFQGRTVSHGVLDDLQLDLQSPSPGVVRLTIRLTLRYRQPISLLVLFPDNLTDSLLNPEAPVDEILHRWLTRQLPAIRNRLRPRIPVAELDPMEQPASDVPPALPIPLLRFLFHNRSGDELLHLEPSPSPRRIFYHADGFLEVLESRVLPEVRGNNAVPLDFQAAWEEKDIPFPLEKYTEIPREISRQLRCLRAMDDRYRRGSWPDGWPRPSAQVEIGRQNRIIEVLLDSGERIRLNPAETQTLDEQTLDLVHAMREALRIRIEGEPLQVRLLARLNPAQLELLRICQDHPLPTREIQQRLLKKLGISTDGCKYTIHILSSPAFSLGGPEKEPLIVLRNHSLQSFLTSPNLLPHLLADCEGRPFRPDELDLFTSDGLERCLPDVAAACVSDGQKADFIAILEELPRSTLRHFAATKSGSDFVRSLRGKSLRLMKEELGRHPGWEPILAPLLPGPKA